VKHSVDDTIAAIVTPVGVGGVGIIRISGKRAKKALFSVFYSQNEDLIESHRMMHGWIVRGEARERIDEVMVCYMESPRSFTGEDVVEVYCHGGQVVLGRVLGLVLKQGIRLAERGEFTKRAFLNGKLDLSQAESILDLINAKTEVGADYAVRQLEGRLKAKTNNIILGLKNILAEIEAEIDFPDDVHEQRKVEIQGKIVKEKEKIERLLKTAEIAKIYKVGISAVIIGKPNVGKSSLLNAIIGEERAIVTDVPGTTRDTIEESLNIKGLAIKIVDTAGIRRAENKVEEAGVKRARNEIQMADIVIMVFDGSAEIDEKDEEVLDEGRDRLGLIVINKADLAMKIKLEELTSKAGEKEAVMVSALHNLGIDALVNKIHEIAIMGISKEKDCEVIINKRHERCLLSAQQSLNKALTNIASNMPVDILSLDIKQSIINLEEISGEALSEEIIEKIFCNFCIGK
jgi:tRNA modification GTPase